jgi:Zn-dependent protease with chaperone function
MLQCSVLAVLLYALDLYALDFAYWLQQIPGVKHFVILKGIAAIALFLLYLGTIWFFSQPAYQIIFQTRVNRWNFMLSHFRLTVPIFIPWVGLVLLDDLSVFLPWPEAVQFFNGAWGQIVTMIGFMLFLLLFFLPRYVPFWWGCKPFPVTEKVSELEQFLKSKGFKCRGLLSWPLFEGRMLTAGIMGIIPRYRYLLVTDGLMDVLSVDELKAVLAHEMGHARYYHMLLYFVVMVAFIVPLVRGVEMFPGLLLALPADWLSFIGEHLSAFGNFLSLLISLPFLLLLLLYFRYVLGYFMRHFERQADLFSVDVMGTPEYTIRSFEKIALFSGKIRDLPSWHHFSIKQRVDYLEKTVNDKSLVKRYNRFIVLCLGVYFAIMIGLIGLFAFGPFSQKNMNANILEALHRNPSAAIQFYEQALKQEPDNPVFLNNLAWFLLKTNAPEIRDPKRALDLAQKAVTLERNAEFFDTLAEAYYANGFKSEAIQAAEEALAAATDKRDFYEKQLARFKEGSAE